MQQDHAPAPQAEVAPDAPPLADGNRVYLKKATGIFQPDVYLETETSGAQVVVKSYHGRPWWVRVSWARLAISRESLAYSRLVGVAGVPAFIERRDACTMVTEYVEAGHLPSRRNPEAIPPTFFPQVRDVYARIHARGVAHGDVRRHNILVTRDGAPLVLDFQTAFLATRWPGLSAWFRFMVRVDEVTITKIQASYHPDSLSDDERQQLANAPWLLRLGRRVRRTFYSSRKAPNRERRARQAAKALAQKSDRTR